MCLVPCIVYSLSCRKEVVTDEYRRFAVRAHQPLILQIDLQTSGGEWFRTLCPMAGLSALCYELPQLLQQRGWDLTSGWRDNALACRAVLLHASCARTAAPIADVPPATGD